MRAGDRFRKIDACQVRAPATWLIGALCPLAPIDIPHELPPFVCTNHQFSWRGIIRRHDPMETLARRRSTSGICRRKPTTMTCANSSKATVTTPSLKDPSILCSSLPPPAIAQCYTQIRCANPSSALISLVNPRQPPSATFCHLQPSSTVFSPRQPSSAIAICRYPSNIFSPVRAIRQPSSALASLANSRQPSYGPAPLHEHATRAPCRFPTKLSPPTPGNT